jgi:DNA-directed RNA polymerase subunit RPC12/RpoP
MKYHCLKCNTPLSYKGEWGVIWGGKVSYYYECSNCRTKYVERQRGFPSDCKVGPGCGPLNLAEISDFPEPEQIIPSGVSLKEWKEMMRR